MEIKKSSRSPHVNANSSRRSPFSKNAAKIRGNALRPETKRLNGESGTSKWPNADPTRRDGTSPDLGMFYSRLGFLGATRGLSWASPPFHIHPMRGRLQPPRCLDNDSGCDDVAAHNHTPRIRTIGNHCEAPCVPKCEANR